MSRNDEPDPGRDPSGWCFEAWGGVKTVGDATDPPSGTLSESSDLSAGFLCDVRDQRSRGGVTCTSDSSVLALDMSDGVIDASPTGGMNHASFSGAS